MIPSYICEYIFRVAHEIPLKETVVSYLLAVWPHIALSTLLTVRKVNPLKPSGHYMYRQFNIQQFYVLPTQIIYVFCVDLRTNSHYFPIQH